MRLSALILIIISHIGYGQTIDEVRLGYDENKIKAKQLAMCSSPDEKYFAVAYSNDTLKLYGIQERRFVKSFYLKSIGLESYSAKHSYLLWLDENQLLMATSNELQIYNPKSGQLSNSIILNGKIRAIDYNKHKRILAVAIHTGDIIIYDTRNFATLNSINTGSFVSSFSISLNASCTKVAAVGRKSNKGGFLAFAFLPARIYDVKSGSLVKEIKSDYAVSLSFNENGSLAIIDATRILRIYNAETYNLDKSIVVDKKSKLSYDEVLFIGKKVMLNKLINLYDVVDVDSGKVSYTTKADQNLLQTFGTRLWPKFSLLGSDNIIFHSNGSNISRIYNLQSNNVIGYFFTDGGSESCIVARDGRVDGDMNALKHLYWTSRKSSEKTYLERTLDKTFTPKLLSQIIANQTVSQSAFEIDNVITQIPALSLKRFNNAAASGLAFNSQSKINKIEVAVTANPQEVEEIRLHQNGKLVKSQNNNGASLYTFDISLTNAFGATNYFYVTSTSKSGIEAEKVSFKIEYSGVTAEAPKLYLLTIGINMYKNSKYNLNYAQADADGVEYQIKTNSASLFPDIVTYSIRNERLSKVILLPL